MTITALDIEQPDALISYLRKEARIGNDESPQIRILVGGVSNRTVLVQRPDGEVAADNTEVINRLHGGAPGVRFDHQPDGEEVEHRRNRGHDDHLEVADAQELRDDERGSGEFGKHEIRDVSVSTALRREVSGFLSSWVIVAIILALAGKKEMERIRGLPQTAETLGKVPNALKGQEEENR